MPDAKALDSALNSAMSYLVKRGTGSGSHAGRELAAHRPPGGNEPRQRAADELERIKSRPRDSNASGRGPDRPAGAKETPDGGGGGLVRPRRQDAAFRKANSGRRAALRAQEWGVVRDSIQAMLPELAAKPEWIWLAAPQRRRGRTNSNALPTNRRPGEFLAIWPSELAAPCHRQGRHGQPRRRAARDNQRSAALASSATTCVPGQCGMELGPARAWTTASLPHCHTRQT